jgi:cytochrome c-type biogenesis protein CcmE
MTKCRWAKSLPELFRAGDAVIAKGVEAIMKQRRDDSLSFAS